MEGNNMDNKENLEQLLHKYGYPEQAIQSIMKDVDGLDYEEVKKRIMPYRDITARRS
jgi:hypothetical protein